MAQNVKISDKAALLDYSVRELHKHLVNVKNNQYDMEYLGEIIGMLYDMQHDIKTTIRLFEEEIKYKE